jgi:hypothetical protein
MSKEPSQALATIAAGVSRAKRQARAWQSANADALANDGVYNAYYLAYRQQPDPTGKKRLVQDWRGRWLYANKALPQAFVRPAGPFEACRARKLNASGLPATWILRILAAKIQAFWEQHYPHFKYHPSGQAVLAKMRRHARLRIYDFSNHDIFIPPDLLRIVVDQISDVWGTALAAQVRWTLAAPQIIKSDYHGTSGVKLDGDVFDSRSWRAQYTNPSGHPLTSIIATFAGLFNWYDAMCTAGAIAEGRTALEQLLRGDAPISALGQGDNVMLGAADDDVLDRIERAQRYGVAKPTESFLGNVYCTDRGTVHVLPDITSYLLGYWLPSRPVDAPLRGHWATGYEARQDVYRSHPYHRALYELEQDVTRRLLGEDIATLVHKNLPAKGMARSLLDELVENDPDLVHYKVNIADLSVALRSSKFILVSHQTYLPAWAEYLHEGGK